MTPHSRIRLLVAAALAAGALLLLPYGPQATGAPFGVAHIQGALSEATIAAVRWTSAVARAAFHPGADAARDAEVAALRAERISVTAVDAEIDALAALLTTHDALTERGLPIPARVVAATLAPHTQEIVVRTASPGAVPIGSPVLIRGALAGTVRRSNGSRAVVQLLTDPRSRVAVRTSDTAGPTGVLEVRGGVPAMTRIPDDATLHVGDGVITAPVSDRIPPGVPVGTITDIRTDPDRLFRTAAIDLLAHPEREPFVTILIAR